MKNNAYLVSVIAAAIISPFYTLHSSAAVPLRWTVETSRVQPAVFDVVRGETIVLEASFNSYGKPVATTNQTAFIAWQTNGMETAWWITNAVTSGTSATAIFTPDMDPGAPTIIGFIVLSDTTTTSSLIPHPSSLSYRAAFTLRFRKGPGATPNVITMPPRVLDLAHTTVINPPWPTQADFAKTTTVMRAELKGYVDSEISGAGLVTPQSVTNAAGTVASNVVTKAYVESLGIESGLDTNAVATVITNHVTSGYLCTVESAQAMTNGKLDKSDGWGNTITWQAGDLYVRGMGSHNFSIDCYAGTASFPDFTLSANFIKDGGDNYLHNKADKATTLSGYGITDAYTKDEIDAAKADASTVSQINIQVQALGANANAEDARVIVTNYNSETKMPEAQFDVKVSNSWITVWHEMTRWNWFLGGYSTYTNGVASALANKGEREWGWFDSATGNPSPDGILQLSQPRIQVCSGAAYQRYVSTTGSVWVLESNGLVADINGTTNGYFRITDEEGNAHFEIVKGDKQILFATAKTMTQQQMGVTHYFTTYAITNAVTTPVAQFSRALNPPTWIKESDSGCPCNVNWTNNGDNSWTVEWWPIGNEPVLFMMAGYEKGGETYIRNVVPVKMQYIYLGNTKYLLGTATINGHTVLTLTAQ